MVQSDMQPEEGTDFISKSQRKRDMLALQDMGHTLFRLPPEVLKKFDLPEELRTALMEAQKISPSKHGGRKRQLQYIGKLMRQIDTAPIVAQLESFYAPSKKQTALLHLAEHWRHRLVNEPDSLALFLNEFPAAEQSRFEKYICAARAEQLSGKPPKHYRLIYQEIHRLILQQSDRAIRHV